MSRSIDCIKLINDFLHPDKHQLRLYENYHLIIHVVFSYMLAFLSNSKRLECLDIPNFDRNTFDFTLHVGGKIFRMKLVWITADTRLQKIFLVDILNLVNSSIFWERHAAIYISTPIFHRITNFLRTTNFNHSTIDRIVNQTKISLDKTQITVVHFKASTPKSIEHEFEQFCSINYSRDDDTQFYIVNAFDFLRPSYLKHSSKPDTRLSMVLYLVIDYHRTQKRNRNIEVFNLIDLCSVKLAFGDSPMENEPCEIVRLIENTLFEMQTKRQYIKSDTFDLELYTINSGIENVPKVILQYFVYYFNKYFSKLIYFDITNESSKLITIQLIDITFMDSLIKFIGERTSATVKIDGTRFNQMGGVLLAQLVKSGVHELILDTSYEWVFDNDTNGSIDKHLLQDLADHVTIIFKNDNTTYFAENCLNWMKSSINVSIVSWTIIFDGCQFHFPFVFNNLNVKEIIINRMRINSKIVNFLNRCQVKRIRLECVRLDSNSNVIASLENVKFLDGTYMRIIEEPHTFQLIFKYVEDYLRANNTFEYQFKRRLVIKNIGLDRFKFIWNTMENWIEIEDLETRTIIDLYLFKELNQQFRADDKDEFDFYQ